MRTFATKQKRLASAVRKARPYAHHPMGTVQLAQRAEIRRILRSNGAQAKLTIGPSNDKCEQEADRLANEVMRMPDPTLQRQPLEEEEEETLQTKPLYRMITPILQRGRIQRQSWPSFDLSSEHEEEPVMTKRNDSNSDTASSTLENSIKQSRGKGTALPDNTLSFMGNRFGTNFKHVRIHNDRHAVQLNRHLNSQAFTRGDDIYFNSGKYDPGSSQGKSLLAHELAHVIQQSASPALQKPGDRYIQRQADITKAPAGLPCILKTGPGHTPGVNILFPVGQNTLSPADKASLAAFAATWIVSAPGGKIFVDGFASTDGAQSTNWRLSCSRAQAVKAELVRNLIPSSNIVTIAHGESTEFSTSDEKENRRAVVSSLPTPSPPAIPPAAPPQPTPLSLKNIKFTSDHGLLKDNNTAWSNTGSVLQPEWITNPLRNKAISQRKNTRLVADVTVNVGPPGTSFDLIGTGVNGNDTSFKKTGNTSTGTDQVITVTADDNLPNAVSHLYRYIVWKIKTGSMEQLAGFSGPHTIYVTYGRPRPIGDVTERRMRWACQKANAQNTPEDIADKIQAGVSSDTSFGGTVDGWNLLAGGAGDCDNQARLMSYAVKLLGVTPATVKLVRASTNSGVGNCLDLETRWFFGTLYLIMDFTVGPGRNWNAFEGACKTAGKYYAITPLIKATDDYDMLSKITCTQHWVKTNVPPGSSGWGVISVHGTVPKP